MNPYFLTVSFLLLMSILTSSEVIRFSNQSLEYEFFTNQLNQKTEIQELTVESKLDDYIVHEKSTPGDNDENKPIKKRNEKGGKKANQRPRKSSSLAFNLDRPPNNSRLNMYLLLHEELLIKGYSKDFSLYETAAQLMRILYSKTSYYLGGCEYKILDELLKNKDKAEIFLSPDDLSSLTFEDESLQNIFYKMLKGEESSPLLHYITFDKKTLEERGQDKKINFLFASPELLYAIFPKHPLLVEKLIAMRDVFWNKVIEQEEHHKELTTDQSKNRNQFKKELTKTFELIINEEGLNSEEYKKIFDLSLGKYGNVLLVYDPLTGLTKREKIYKQPKTKKN